MKEKYNNLQELIKDLEESGAAEYERYDAVKRFLCDRAREKGVPISGNFELTPLCNLDCRMCYVHLHKEQLQDRCLLTVEEWKQIMQEAIDHGMLYATLTGGECLTYPGFKELFLFLRNQGIEVAILTNGVLLTEETVTFFKKNPPSLIQVTVYGSSEDGYERVTGHRMFTRVMEGIQRLKNAGLYVRLAFTPNTHMDDDGENIIRLMEKLQISYKMNPGLLTPRQGTGREQEEHDLPLKEYVKLYKLKAKYEGKPEYCLYDGELPAAGGPCMEEKAGLRCGTGRMTFWIQWEGEMRPCSMLQGISANVLETGFSTAWKAINQGVLEYKIPRECVGCPYEEKCKTCVVEREQEHISGDKHRNPAACEWVQNMIREGVIPFEEYKELKKY